MAEPVMHYFAKNTSQTTHLDYGIKVRDKMTRTLCGRLLHGHDSPWATKNKDEVTCKKCLTHKL